MKLPNGYGSVVKMSGRRRNPYMVRKTVGWHYDPDKDRQVQDYTIIGYAKTKAEGLKLLAEYNGSPYDVDKKNLTFSDVWTQFERYKFGDDKDSSSYRAYHSAYTHCKSLYKKKFSSLKRSDLQAVIDGCDKAKATLENIRLLFNQLYKFAQMEDICQKDYSRFTTIGGKEDETGEPFSEAAIQAIWDHQDSYAAKVTLMLIYSGLRVSELKAVEINLDEATIRGGLKSSASKARYAPIHEETLQFWKTFDQGAFDPGKFREKNFYPLMNEIGYAYEHDKKHTPHDCRHTFSWLADKYRMDETCKHLIMGHKLKGDVEQVTYRHRTMDELRSALNSIKKPGTE